MFGDFRLIIGDLRSFDRCGVSTGQHHCLDQRSWCKLRVLKRRCNFFIEIVEKSDPAENDKEQTYDSHDLDCE